MNFIKLTHYSTGNVTYLKSEDITSVSQGFDRTLIICTNGQGAHYREGAEYIMDLIHGETYPPAVEYGEPTQADFEMGHVAGVCDLGPIPQPNKEKAMPLEQETYYRVVAKYDANFNNDVEINTYRTRVDAIEMFKMVIDDFKDSISGQLDLDECDFEDMKRPLPSVYLQDESGEDSVRVYVEEEFIL
jgi:hypothetical protein